MIGMDDSDFMGVIIEQTERSSNVISVHFAMSLWSDLGNHLKSQADYVDSFKMKSKSLRNIFSINKPPITVLKIRCFHLVCLQHKIRIKFFVIIISYR
jgi:hypothetical protein